MKGVSRGARVRWTETYHLGSGTFTKGRPTSTEYHGVVLDRSDEQGKWWVKPDGLRDAVKVLAKDMQQVLRMHGQ